MRPGKEPERAAETLRRTELRREAGHAVETRKEEEGLGSADFSSALKVGREDEKRIFSALLFPISPGTTQSLSIILIDSICQGRWGAREREFHGATAVSLGALA